MSLVGDLILSFRELATDLPQTMPTQPFITSGPTSVNVPNGAFAPLSPVHYQITALNQWGETLPTIEGATTVGAGMNALQFGITPGFSATFIRIYYGTLTGQENSYEQFATPPGLSTFTLLNLSVAAAVPPYRNTAYLPDTDGQSLSAYAVYRWMNQALAWAAAKNRGGLPDFGAVGTTGGIGNYVMNGYWKKIDNGWYDGYPLGLLSKNNVFRRQPVTGYSGSLTIFQATDRLMVELWPQPSRTSARATLASPMAATDTVANLTSTANFVLGFGLAQIGSEVVYYAGYNGNQLTGLLRGMNGTTPAAWPINTAATELNLLVSGFRVPSTYSVGQAATTLYLPPGWDEALMSYMLYRFRSAEQDDKAAQRYLAEATQKMSDLSANRIIAGPRQIQPWGSNGPEIAVGLGSPFGGVIIP